MKRTRSLLPLLLSGLFATGACRADSGTTLRLANWLPARHALVRDVLVPWASDVRQATEGRVRVDVMSSPLGAPSAAFDLANDGVADLAFGVHAYTPGRFVLSEVAELPFLSNSAEALSVAYWRVHQQELSASREHRGVKLLGLWTHGPGHLFNGSRPVQTLSDQQGMKLRVGGELATRISEALGAVSVATPATKAYETLANGVADGLSS